MNNNQNGGKVIASGGFGCIFEPSLKCENNSYSDPDKISKLMITKYAEDEFKQIEKFKQMLNTIPNYENYFLLNNFELCRPAKLTQKDLNGYSSKCKALKKKGIKVRQLNKSLNNLKIINMPNGGIDVENFVKEYFNINSNISLLNNSLINLLIKGIIPMNNLNIYHCDIKDANVLVKIVETGLETRLIDWGLSVIWRPKQTSHGIPRKLYRRPFQFNVPFSSILFNKDFLKLYNDFLVLNPNPDYFQIREFIINYIFIWNDIRGPGHLTSINSIIKKLTIKDLTAIKKEKIKDHFIEYDFTYYYIIEYLSKILEKYTIKGNLNIMDYFQSIFLKNIDIWGFVMIYVSIYEYFYNSYDKLNHYQMEFITQIKYIIIHFLFENPTNIINISSLVNELTNLNKVIEKFDFDENSKKLEYNSLFIENIGGLKKNNNKNINKINKKNKINSKTNKNNRRSNQKTRKIR